MAGRTSFDPIFWSAFPTAASSFGTFSRRAAICSNGLTAPVPWGWKYKPIASVICNNFGFDRSALISGATFESVSTDPRRIAAANPMPYRSARGEHHPAE